MVEILLFLVAVVAAFLIGKKKGHTAGADEVTASLCRPHQNVECTIEYEGNLFKVSTSFVGPGVLKLEEEG